MQEIFKKHISGALVSTLGSVIGVSGKPLTPTVSKHGYAIIGLKKPDGSITRSVHRAVIETFVGDIPKGMVVNHKNGIKLDNRLDNLEIVTPSDNTKHAIVNGLAEPMSGERNGMAKLTEADIVAICAAIMRGSTNDDISLAYGLHTRYVSLIRHKRRWRKYIPDWYVPSDSLGNTGVPVYIMVNVLRDCEDTSMRNADIAAKWGLDRSTISRVRSGKTWKAFSEYYKNTVVQRLSPAGEYTQVGGNAEHL